MLLRECEMGVGKLENPPQRDACLGKRQESGLIAPRREW